MYNNFNRKYYIVVVFDNIKLLLRKMLKIKQRTFWQNIVVGKIVWKIYVILIWTKEYVNFKYYSYYSI